MAPGPAALSRVRRVRAVEPPVTGREVARPSGDTGRLPWLGMDTTHRERVENLLSRAAEDHATLLSRLPPDLSASIPVDAQGVTQAIDYLATAAGLSAAERRALIRPHAVNPAVLHARVFGGAPLTPETVMASFVEGARVRADALATLADTVGGEGLGRAVRALLVESPPPVTVEGGDVLDELRSTYAAHERAAVLIAAALDVS